MFPRRRWPTPEGRSSGSVPHRLTRSGPADRTPGARRSPSRSPWAVMRVTSPCSPSAPIWYGVPVIGSGAALLDSTYVTNAVDALVVALDCCVEARGQALVVTNGEPRPITELVGSICAAAGVPPPTRHVPVPLAATVGTAVQTASAILDRLRRNRPAADPPITRFIVEQMSTAHWFDQRHTREVLQWRPRMSLDEGFSELRRWFQHGQSKGNAFRRSDSAMSEPPRRARVRGR